MGQLSGWLWRALRGNRLQAALNAAVGLASVAVSLAAVWAVQRAIDIAAGAQQGSLYWAVGLMALFTACEFGLGIARVWIKNILGIKAQNHMQQQMLDRLRSEWRGRERYHSGDVINRLEQDVATVVTFVTETLPGTLSVAAMFTGAFAYLLRMDAVLAIITVAMLPVFMLASRIYITRMRKLTRRVRRSDSRVQSLLQETVQNRMLIKTLECDSHIVSRLDSTQSVLRRHVRRRTAFSVMSNLLLNSGFSLGYLVAFLWSALRLQQGTLTFGGMTAFLQLVYRIQSPARDLTRLAPAFVAVFTAAERLMELEEMPQEEHSGGKPMGAPCGVRLEGVSYAYDDGKDNVIDGLSFDFRPGTCTAILGETGAGKTTLIRLILALIRPTAGSIAIYNADESREVSPADRCNFVYVPQGNTLLSGTVRTNLRLGPRRIGTRHARGPAHGLRRLRRGAARRARHQGCGGRRGPERRPGAADSHSQGPAQGAERNAIRRGHERTRPRHREATARKHSLQPRQDGDIHHPPARRNGLLRPDAAPDMTAGKAIHPRHRAAAWRPHRHD